MSAGNCAEIQAEKGIGFKHLASKHSKTRATDCIKDQDKYRMNK
jgi:hypothetical protein